MYKKVFPLFLNPFPLSDVDETSYIDLFWDVICEFLFLIPSAP